MERAIQERGQILPLNQLPMLQTKDKPKQNYIKIKMIDIKQNTKHSWSFFFETQHSWSRLLYFQELDEGERNRHDHHKGSHIWKRSCHNC